MARHKKDFDYAQGEFIGLQDISFISCTRSPVYESIIEYIWQKQLKFNY